MKTEIKDKFKVVAPSDGMWLTNGETFSQELYMPLSADESAWVEISEEEKERREAEMLTEINSLND